MMSSRLLRISAAWLLSALSITLDSTHQPSAAYGEDIELYLLTVNVREVDLDTGGASVDVGINVEGLAMGDSVYVAVPIECPSEPFQNPGNVNALLLKGELNGDVRSTIVEIVASRDSAIEVHLRECTGVLVESTIASSGWSLAVDFSQAYDAAVRELGAESVVQPSEMVVIGHSIESISPSARTAGRDVYALEFSPIGRPDVVLLHFEDQRGFGQTVVLFLAVLLFPVFVTTSFAVPISSNLAGRLLVGSLLLLFAFLTSAALLYESFLPALLDVQYLVPLLAGVGGICGFAGKAWWTWRLRRRTRSLSDSAPLVEGLETSELMSQVLTASEDDERADASVAKGQVEAGESDSGSSADSPSDQL